MVSSLLLSVALANPYAGSTLEVAPAAPFQWTVPARAVDVIEVVLAVPNEHRVYRDTLSVRSLRGTIGPAVFPDAVLQPDLYEPGQYRASYATDVVVRIPVEAVDQGAVQLELTVQGCRAGLCWPIAVTQHEVAVALTPKEMK